MLIPKTEDLLPYLDLETLQWKINIKRREMIWFTY